MSKLSQRTTIYLNPSVKKFIQHKAVAEGRSVSEIVNDEFADMLEDLEDLRDARVREHEPKMDFAAFMAELKADGLL